MTEIWRVCQDWPNIEVSNLGNIRNTKTKKPKYKRINKQGYYETQTKVCGKRHTLKVHRLVALAFLPPPAENLIESCSKEHWGVVLVNHLDGNKLNNSSDNLEWCDMRRNNNHASFLGLTPVLRGEKQGRAKLTDSEVHEICKAFEQGMMPKEAVQVFNISKQQATKIRAGHAWKHISCLYDISVNKRSTKFND